MTAITKKTVSKGEFIPLWKITQAHKRFPNHDWKAWERASLRLRKNQYESEDERMKDQGIADQGTAIIKAESHDYGLREITPDAQRSELLKVVSGMYSRDNLSEADLQVIVEIAKGNNINPAAPGAMFAYKRKKSVNVDGKWQKVEETVIGLGYQSYISIAHQQVEFIMKPSRAMTPEERITHDVGEGDVGVIVLAYRNEDLQQVAKMKAMGLDADWRDFAVVGVGKWRKEAYKDNNGNPKPDSIPETWDKYMVAENRAVKNLCRRLGIVTLIPSVSGAQVTNNDDDSAYVITSGIQESAPSLPEAIEGEVTDFEAPESTSDETPDVIPVQSEQAGEKTDAAEPEAPKDDPLPVENAGSMRDTAGDVTELGNRLYASADAYREKMDNPTLALTREQAREYGTKYNHLFADALPELEYNKAVDYRIAFTNHYFTFVMFTATQLADAKALDIWSKDEAAAAIEIQMFRDWWDGQKSEEGES